MVSVKWIRNFAVPLGLILLLLSNNANGAATGFLTDVKIAQDQKRIVIKHEGDLGKHAAFVIERPHRLVVDFSSTALGKTPRKINVNGREIREIRLGQTPSRARLVVDFGSNPVPAFRIQRMDGALLVMLGSSIAPRSAQGPGASAERERTASSFGKSKSVPESAKSQASPLAVKRAGIEDDLVYVELVDKNKPGKTYRLVVDCSLRKLAVRHASLSDEAGMLRRFDLAENSAAKEDDSTARITAEKGPRRIGEHSRPFVRAKFHWGKPVVRARQPDDDRDKMRGPFKMEELKLKVRKQDT
jgi:hypothetical protein